MSKYSEVIKALRDAQKRADDLLSDQEDHNHQIKIHTEVQRVIDYIATVTGSADIGDSTPVKLGPAKTIAGKKIEYKATTRPEDVAPDEFKVQKLKDKVEALFDSFLTIDTEDLLKNYEDTVIRGVAKKAKMKVTKDNPARLTMDFIDEIKLEIKNEQIRQAQLENKGAKVLSSDSVEFIEPDSNSTEPDA